MLVKAAVRPWVAVSGGSKRTLDFSYHSCRSLSTFTLPKKSFQLRSRPPIQNASGLIRISPWSPVLLQSAGPSSARFNSTATTPMPPSDPAASVPADSVLDAPISGGAQSIDLLSAADLANVDISQIPEKLGYLKAVGLDYGWGPSRVIETILESFHIYGGLPWWGAAIGTAVFLRVLVLKFAMDASDTSAKVASVKHLTQPLQEEVQRCYRENDTVGMQRAQQERKIINETHNIKLLKLAFPLVQVPLSFGAFRVLRGMSALPVPGLDSESFLWLHNVTLHDPYFILPIATGIVMHYTFKLGGETAGANDPTTMMAKPIMLYGLPVLSAICTSFLPGILQMFFATTSVLAIGQSYAFRNSSFRSMTGMAPFPSRPVTPGVTEPKVRILEARANNSEQSPTHIETVPKASFIDRFLSSFQKSIKSTRKKMENYTGQNNKVEKYADGTPKARMTKKQLEDAIAYENRRREELAIERETRNKERQMEYRRKAVEKRRKQREI
ncbi:conserved hypothetical protein [Histoplasma capsulatum G186AR]|uniref:Membrane insertase YidC/Oxa/ALB C-terminal domain-containing protein n=2 Tax=Ajellomyces capsulatus TaxID=5037 RepID=C0NTP7_AJECG|nr:membrane insertase OXA1 [Histoplasma capsulatum G186AR]EEH05408.1 conserved hypothetical protein [Histoplasma capsulatum G186AR]KAG5305226.1 mitochondrial Oxa1p [Histoplasma capsulatum]QSS76187.1 mitochondrial Oxa1p [Histoplasma capsulatum G186AR]